VVDLEKPEAPYIIEDIMPMEGSEIYLLESGKPVELHMEDSEEWDNGEGGTLVIEELPDPLPCDHAWSFKIWILDQSWLDPLLR
jgi:hypothetical protein